MEKDLLIDSMIEKIAKECEEAQASEWDVTKIVKELSGSGITDIGRLRERAIQILSKLNPNAATIYESFHRLRVYTSAQKIEPFDRGNIIKSLLKETNVSRSVAAKIGHEVEDIIKDLKISNLTTALIREIVNTKLLEYGYENVRNQYARLGLPVYEVRNKINSGFYENDDILKEYNLTNVIPQEISRLHFSSDIFIFDIPGFSTRQFSCSLNGECENSGLLEKLLRISPFFKKFPSINAVNFCFRQNEKKELVNFVKMLNALASARGSKAHFSTSLFLPELLEKSARGAKEGFWAANKLVEMQKNYGFNMGVAVDSKYNLKSLEEFPKENALFLNCKDSEFYSASCDFFSSSNEICSATALNISKIALQNREKEDSFFNELRIVLSHIKKLSEIKENEISKREYFRKENAGDKGLPHLLETGCVFEASSLFGNSGERDIIKFSEKILRALKEGLGENWDIAEISDAEAKMRFSELNEKFSKSGAEINSDALFLKSGSFVKKNYFKICSAKNREDVGKMLENGVLAVRI